MRIACLHTAESNVAVFARAAEQRGLVLTHQVRADLLAAAMQAGSVTAKIAARTGDALLALQNDTDAVLLTCSTLGAVADDIVGKASIPVLRVDAALAGRAVAEGGPVAVLCAAETTLGPTGALFEQAARQTQAVIDLRLVPKAWSAFLAGAMEDYLVMIAAAADQAFSEGITTVALAQASMADAAALCRHGTPLSSPAAGLDAVVAALRR